MQAQELDLGHLAHPDAGSHPGVVLIPDVWGLSDHYRDLAGRLAGEGFAVLAIDPYRKTGHPKLSDPSSAMAWIRELPDPVVIDTIQEAIDALVAHPSVSGRKVGIVGFCMGGQYALLAACTCRGLSACAPCYGMVRYAADLDPGKKPRSPLDALPGLTCPLLGLYGAEDAIIPPGDVEALRAGLEASGRPFELHVYEGAGHAFMNETRPPMYRPEAARDAWGRLVPFLRERLA